MKAQAPANVSACLVLSSEVSRALRTLPREGRGVRRQASHSLQKAALGTRCGRAAKDVLSVDWRRGAFQFRVEEAGASPSQACVRSDCVLGRCAAARLSSNLGILASFTAAGRHGLRASPCGMQRWSRMASVGRLRCKSAFGGRRRSRRPAVSSGCAPEVRGLGCSSRTHLQL